jgi:hypothetical protein
LSLPMRILLVRRELLIVVAFLVTLSVGCHRSVDAETVVGCPSDDHCSFDPRSFGANLNLALLNPFERNVTGVDLRRQVSRALYDVRMIGGLTARWLPTNVWHQYRCSVDPEDQRTGEIDPAWEEITRVLLEEAQKQQVHLVIVLMNMANGGFAGVPPDTISRSVSRWNQYRIAHQVEYGNTGSCDGSFQNGYYGESRSRGLFDDAAVIQHMKTRSVAMARHLAGYPALGAIQLFAEPNFDATHTLRYARAVSEIREAIRAAVPALSSVPIISGTAWWDLGVVRVATEGGYLSKEPFITVDSYIDYTRGSDFTRAKLNGLIEYLRRLVPERPIAIAEAGSSTRLPELSENRAMVQTLVDTEIQNRVGVWVWGVWIPGDEGGPDYKWAFNVRAPAGVSLRGLVTNPDQELIYRSPRQVDATDAKGNTVRATVTIRPAAEGTWVVDLNGEDFIGVSHAGVFPQSPGSVGFGVPEPALFLPLTSPNKHWLRIAPAGASWTFELHDCATQDITLAPTPLYVLDLAKGPPASLPQNCTSSSVLLRGII